MENSTGNTEIQYLRSQIAALEQLLEVYEKPALEQADKLYGEISERQKAEKAIKASEQFLQTLLDSIPAPVFYKDTDGKYTGCNKAFEDFLSLLHFHLATSETIARVILYDREELNAGESCYCQLRLNDPVVTLSGDRYIVRKFSPVITIGGGTVLDPAPERRKRRDSTGDLDVFLSGSLTEKIAAKVRKAGLRGLIPASFFAGWIRAELLALEGALGDMKKGGDLVRLNDTLFHREIYEGVTKKIAATLADFHRKNPLSPGMLKMIVTCARDRRSAAPR